MNAFLRNSLLTVAALSALWWIGGILREVHTLDPRRLPDHDFLPEISRLMAEGKFKSAELLCCDVIGMGLPNSRSAQKKLLQCREAQRHWGRNAAEAVKGFVSGRGHSGAALAGAAASDLFLYGDLRDLGIQAYRRIRNLPVDSVTVLLSGIGAAAELAGSVKIPALLVKQLYRAGSLSAKMLDHLRTVFLRLKNGGAVDPADKKLFSHLNSVIASQGSVRGHIILRSVRNPRELEAVVKLQKKAPGVPFLIARAAPVDGGELLLRFSADSQSMALLKSASRKGKAGTVLLKKIRLVKFTLKNFFYGRFRDMLVSAALTDGTVRNWLRLSAFFFGALSLLFGSRIFICAGKFLRRRKEANSKAGDGARSLPGDNAPDSNNSGCSC